MATTAEIRNKAAEKLGLLGTGQTLEPSISNDLDDAYTETYNELLAEDLVTWTSTGAIPNELVEPVVALVAAARATRYGVPEPRYSRVVGEGLGAKNRIRERIAQSQIGQTKIEAF